MMGNREIPGTVNSVNVATINQFELFHSKLRPVTRHEKKVLGIQGGIKVVTHLTGKLAQRTHMCSGFVICTINDQVIHTVEDFSRATENKKGVMLGGVYPDGRRDHYYLELE